MPSPFPGMDPWLESPAVFPDLHNRLISALSEALNAVLPEPFFAAIANRVFLEESERRVEPDVDVLRPANGPEPGERGGTAVLTVTELLVIQAAPPDEETTETYVEIRAAPGGERLVTSVEVLSLTNKTRGADGRGLYRAKQGEMFRSGVNLVEIDLLRGGAHATLVPVERLRQRAGAFDYHVCLFRADRPGEFFAAPFRLPQRLPRIPVPLVPGVADVVIDLQPLLDRCYDGGLYRRRVRYGEWAHEPPLTAEQRAWAEQVLRERGLLEVPPAGAV